MSQQDRAAMTGRQFRALCRSGEFTGPTAGVARGFVQANLVVLTADTAEEFRTFCRLNPKPCPLLEVTSPGDYETRSIAPCGDVRADLPRYRVYRQGQCTERTASIEPFWTDDSVAFLIGCSFTFESALLRAGLPVRHIDENRNVPMYRTNIECRSAGRFTAPLVVSMRPMTPAHAGEAARITAEYPRVHGDPMHIGDPAAIGIVDLSLPDYGDAVTIHPDEIPVFWACGVTPMEAIIRAELALAVTHEPGHMFVADLHDQSLREPPQAQ